MRASQFHQHPELGEEYWGEHPDHPLDDWQYEVANDDTRLGYWDWVKFRIEERDS